MNIGEDIRYLRLQNGLTQEELADRCELSKGYISQLENDITSPSISTLVDILTALGSNLNDFFSGQSKDQIVFKDEDIFVKEEEEYTIHWLVTHAQKNAMEPIMLAIEPNGKSVEYDPHESEMFGYLLEGKISLFIGEKEYKVSTGESFYISKPKKVHYIKNNSKTKARLIWVSTPPIF